MEVDGVTPDLPHTTSSRDVRVVFTSPCTVLSLAGGWTFRQMFPCGGASRGLGEPAYVLSHCSHVRFFVIPWTVAHQAPLSMGFSRQEYWSGLPCPPPGAPPEPGIKPRSLMSPALASGFFTTNATWEAQGSVCLLFKIVLLTLLLLK